MEKITFISSAGTIEIDNQNGSTLTGEKILRLNSFDGNSVKTRLDAVQCIDMPGQRVLSSVPDVKVCTAKISFAPVYAANNYTRCTGEAGMHYLRREVLRHFPLGENGTLIYTDEYDTYTITARLDEQPVVTVRDGYLCECTLMLTCDYPYWCKTIICEPHVITGGNYYVFEPPEYGDVASPVGGIVECLETIGYAPDGIYFQLLNTDVTVKRLNFRRQLAQGNVLEWSFLYNNEWSVKLNGEISTNSVYFGQYCEPCVSIPGSSKFRFNLLSSTGSVKVKLVYRNLFNVI